MGSLSRRNVPRPITGAGPSLLGHVAVTGLPDGVPSLGPPANVSVDVSVNKIQRITGVVRERLFHCPTTSSVVDVIIYFEFLTRRIERRPCERVALAVLLQNDRSVTRDGYVKANSPCRRIGGCFANPYLLVSGLRRSPAIGRHILPRLRLIEFFQE